MWFYRTSKSSDCINYCFSLGQDVWWYFAMLKLHGSNFVYLFCVLFWQGGGRGVGWGVGVVAGPLGYCWREKPPWTELCLPVWESVIYFLNKIWTELKDKSTCFVIGFFKIKELFCMHLFCSIILLFQKVHTGTWSLWHMLWFLEYVHGTYST